MARTSWRTGAPVTSACGNGDPATATAPAAPRLPIIFETNPGRRPQLPPTNGIRRNIAAKVAGKLAYPPTLTTTFGERPRINDMALHVEPTSFGKNNRLRTDSDRCNPTTSSNVWAYPVGGSKRRSTPWLVPT